MKTPCTFANRREMESLKNNKVIKKKKSFKKRIRISAFYNDILIVAR